MFEIRGEVQTSVKIQDLLKATEDKLALGGARAADLILGKLRAYSTRDILHRRSGNLARGWEVKPEGLLAWRFINRMPYARILELGGTITPKKAKALAVPISGGPAATAAGVSRYQGGPRSITDHHLFVLKLKTGKAFLAERVGKGRLELWYALRQMVKIPAFHYASRAIEAAKPSAAKEIRNALKG